MKGTKLWQDTGSALISGYSRHREAVLARLAHRAPSAAFAGAFARRRGHRSVRRHRLLGRRALRMDSRAGRARCSARLPGVWLAGKLGSLKRWQLGAVVGLIFGAAARVRVCPYLAAGLSWVGRHVSWSDHDARAGRSGRVRAALCSAPRSPHSRGREQVRSSRTPTAPTFSATATASSTARRFGGSRTRRRSSSPLRATTTARASRTRSRSRRSRARSPGRCA